MKIKEFFSESNKEHWLGEIQKSDWKAGSYLYTLLQENRLRELCGEDTKLLMLTDGEHLVSFCEKYGYSFTGMMDSIYGDECRVYSRKIDRSIFFRRLTYDDIDTFIGMRISQLREEGATENTDLVPALKDYYSRHMADGTFVSWLACDGEKIIGTSGMSFVEKPPYFGCPNGRTGLLSSMYTDPGYRRRGIARELLDRVVNEARSYGCGVVQITASDMGVLLYTTCGFSKNSNFMQYRI